MVNDDVAMCREQKVCPPATIYSFSFFFSRFFLVVERSHGNAAERELQFDTEMNNRYVWINVFCDGCVSAIYT